MRKMLLVLLLAGAGATQVVAQYPVVTVRQIQQQPLDSLKLADSLQSTAAARWTLQAAPLIKHAAPFTGDTVTVVALCVVPPKVLTFTGAGFTMLLYDTSRASAIWKGLLVRASSDTATHKADGFLNVKRGYVIQMTGVVSEFPTGSYNSVTQFQPIPNFPIVVLDTGKVVPPPVRMTIGDFYRGKSPGGLVQYSTGEPFESMIVELTDLTLDAKFNLTRGTFSVVDADGNQIAEYDASRYFTLGHGTIVGPPDSLWAIKFPLLGVGTKVDTLRGMITTVSGQENPRGYRISPLYRGDIVFGVVPPALTTHRRNPVVVPSDSAARISVVARKQPGGSEIASVSLLYSVDNGGWQTLPMSLSDTTYKASIPQNAQNAFVKYFIKCVDSAGVSAILASSASGAFGSDTSKGFFFYNVLNRPLTIRDIQYTPFPNGRSAYIGGAVSVSGVVTADTANIGRSPLNTGGTNSWYMQNGNQPWKGIWFDDTTKALLTLRNGDSVTVTGSVTERFEVTQITNFTSPPLVLASGQPLPPPVVATTGVFGPTVGNGTPGAEQWEGMLVRFNNVVVTDTSLWTFADPTEFAVDDGTGPVLVRRDGRHKYSNVRGEVAGGKTILYPGDRIASLTGVMFYSFNRYKLVPRTNSDFGPITTSVEITRNGETPASYELAQNYPNPFNPATLIGYTLPSGGLVTLAVFNVLGQEVKTLVNERQPAGKYTVRFDASSLASGLYFYRLQTSSVAGASFTQVKKMLLVK